MKSVVKLAAVATLCLIAARSARCDFLYASCPGANLIEKCDLSVGNSGTVFANSGMNSPEGLTLDSADNLYVSNFNTNTINEFAPDGTPSTFIQSGLKPRFALAFDNLGNLFAAASNNATIEKIAPGGNITTFENRIGVQFMTFDSTGSNLYVSLPSSNQIGKYTSDGSLSIFASSGLSSPSGLAFDSSGNLYVASLGDKIVKFTPNGNGSVFASSSLLDAPQGMAFDSSGNLYVACSDSIAKVTPSGSVSMFAFLADPKSPEQIVIEPTPEPSTFILAACGALGVMLARRKRSQLRPLPTPPSAASHQSLAYRPPLLLIAFIRGQIMSRSAPSAVR